MRPKDTLEPTKQDGVLYKIPCECGKLYIGETGRAMRERKQEHDRDIRLARVIIIIIIIIIIIDCDWFTKLLFSTNSLAKLLLDSSISQPHSKF